MSVIQAGTHVVGGAGGMFGTSTAAAGWNRLLVGSGGYVRGLNIAPDGTMVGRTDTNGAYLWNGSIWNQLFTPTNIPSTIYNATNIDGGFGGCFEIQIAPTNTQILYAALPVGYVFKSTNQGSTWSNTGFAQISSDFNPNDNYGQCGQKMAVDPNNASIVFVGTELNGLWYTTNGGTSWTQVSTSSVPVGSGAGITGILFYGNGPQSGGATQTLYACSNGNGVYKSTNGGSTWTLTSSGPTTVQYAAIDTSGNYYAINQTFANLFKYSGTWATTTAPPNGNTLQAVAINPFNQSEVMVSCQGGQVAISYDAGSTWSGYNSNTSLVSTDIPWLQQANYSVGDTFFYLSAGGLAYSPVTNGELIQSAGTGCWNMTVPSSGMTSGTALTWTDFSVGIEQLVANAILIPPTSGAVPILASWDRPFFKISSLSAYPSAYGPVSSLTIQMGWSLDYASSNPAYVFGLSVWNNNQSGVTTDNGATWTNFSGTWDPGGNSGGTIAASTPTNIVLAPSGQVQPGYSTDGGATWTGITLPGVSSWTNFHYAYYLKQRSVCADRVTANTFYLYFPGNGVFSTSNGGATWSNVYNGNSGYIESNSSFAGKNSALLAVPGNVGHLFYTSGNAGGDTPAGSSGNVPFYRSINAGVGWSAVSNVTAVQCFAFGAIKSGQSYPSIYIYGYVSGVLSIWRSDDDCVTWTNMGNPNLSNDWICCIASDPNNWASCYIGYAGGGYAYNAP